jgi:hypothetical protein
MLREGLPRLVADREAHRIRSRAEGQRAAVGSVGQAAMTSTGLGGIGVFLAFVALGFALTRVGMGWW